MRDNDFRTETWRTADIEEVKALIRAAQYQIDAGNSEGAISSLAASMRILQK